MNANQRRHQQEVAEAVVEATGLSIDKTVAVIENPRILRLILRLETAMLGGVPRRRMALAIARRLKELKGLKLRTCRHCGCTERHGCPGGCAWANEDSCTQCNP